MGCGEVDRTRSRAEGTPPDFRSKRLVGRRPVQKGEGPLCRIKVKTLNEGTCHPRRERQLAE